MKQIYLIAGLAFIVLNGCKNSDNSQKTGQTSDTPSSAQPAPEARQEVASTPVTLDAALLEKNTAKAKQNLSGLKDLLKQLEALPAAVRQNKAAQIEDFRNSLSGMIVKMQKMTDNLEKIARDNKPLPAGRETSDQGSVSVVADMQVLKSATSDLDRYGEDVKNYQDAINQLKEGK